MMGGSCSLQRQRAIHWSQEHRNSQNQANAHRGGRQGRKEHRRSPLRHSVDSELPDRSIAALYPVQENYVVVSNNRRSPRSLVELCTDAICRSLPDLDGELPPRLPQDVVDNIVHSLLMHSALNSSTLRALKNCEMSSLSLAGCRGVTDDWLIPLSSRSLSSSPTMSHMTPPACGHLEPMDLDLAQGGGVQTDSFETSADTPNAIVTAHQSSSIIIYREVPDESTSSSCSTSSFVSASSTPFTSCDMEHSFEGTQANLSSDNTSHSTTLETITVYHPDVPSLGMTHISSLTSNLTSLDLSGSQRLTDKGLLQLTDLSSVEVVKLDNCHALVGRGLLALASSHRLRTLSLANCRRLTDEAVINISHLSSIEALSLDGCRCITDGSLAAMSGLFALRKLDLSQCDLLSDDGLHHLQDIEFLEELSLGWCRSVTDRGLEILAKQPGRSIVLQVLRLARCTITNEGIPHVATLTALLELDLNGCANIGSSSVARMLESLVNLTILDVSYCPGILRSSWQGKIRCLRSLELCYSGVRDESLSRLRDLPNLEELNLDSCPVGDWAIAHLADNNVVPNLTSLDLADTEITDLGMAHLPKFKHLTRLSLFYCNISNAGLRHLQTMTNLEVLNLDSREIGDDGLSYLRKLTRLQSLDVFSGRITDHGCAHISKVKSLTSLELCGGGIGDLGCTLLATLENLTSLNLSQNERISNRGAAALAALTNLKALNLSNTRVNSGALRFFSGLVKLQSLALYGCRGIENSLGIDHLQGDLPSLKCLRLNVSSDDDGAVNLNPDYEDEESDSSDEDHFSAFDRYYGSQTGEGEQDEDDDDEHMEVGDDVEEGVLYADDG